jgi:hypothetical protein
MDTPSVTFLVLVLFLSLAGPITYLPLVTAWARTGINQNHREVR